ncbi:PQ-loop-domain-containing protein [Saitoella complicata NRRL Y-17804]|nr:PQ-loop-domain-containing protein [Saitoella complicata NRRL Y-17804]ODQ53058.1 PQ-loop-domain-containing protein [Saitoella complicata NRRL Y-17804]
MAVSELRQELSGVSGSISLACWLVVLLPQLYENYRLHSASGVSLTFILAWLIGDVLSLAGALTGGLLSTVVVLSAYFCVADGVLIAQVVYYNYLNKASGEGHAKTRRTSSMSVVAGAQDHIVGGGGDRETAPLLRGRSTSTASKHSLREQARARRRKAILQNISAVILVIAAGILGYLLTSHHSLSSPAPTDPQIPEAPKPTPSLLSSTLGYASALTYLLARIPQLLQNHRRRATDGLSILFFVFSMLGNVSFAASIMFGEEEWRGSAPWLVGSVGTIVEDLGVFWQFWAYGRGEEGEGDDEEAVV